MFSIEEPTPRHDYALSLQTIAKLVVLTETELGGRLAPVGIGMPGSIVPTTGLVQNANSTWLNGKNFQQDISTLLTRDVRLANDANCFALSEAVDGAAAGAASVFGVIMGTGVGGGLVLDGQIVNGPRSIGGEWGHCSLPFPERQDFEQAHSCWCGQRGCIESWLSGPGMLSHYNERHQARLQRVEALVDLAEAGDEQALAHFERHAL